MARLGFEPSRLHQTMVQASEVVEMKERVEHAAPATLVRIRFESPTTEQYAEAYVSRSRLLALLTEEEKEQVERAHRLMHGVTGD